MPIETVTIKAPHSSTWRIETVACAGVADELVIAYCTEDEDGSPPSCLTMLMPVTP